MNIPFVGRVRELQTIDGLWQRERAAMLVLYGRRRVGKTRLLIHWMQQSGARALYWVAEPSTALDQLRSFSQALYNFANPTLPAPPEFTYANWTQAFEQVAQLAQQQRFALILDEFTYLLEVEPSLASRLQHLWDQTLSQSNLLLMICGSHLGMMLRHLLTYQAPLYGRATAQLRLQPLPFGVAQQYFPDYDADERVAIYAIWGGIPAYWERLNPNLSISENIRHELLTANNLMQTEPRLLLQDFINDPHNYVGILRAIANNARTQKEIVAFTGLAQSHISPYLSTLQEAGFVERKVPVTKGEPSRLGRYHIVDPYLRFYYRFLANRQTQLALGVQEQALEEIKRHLRDFIGMHTWEELCREWLLRASANGSFTELIDQVGSVWTSSAQVDVVGLNSMTKVLVLGECKWGTQSMGRTVLTDLLAKTAAVIPGSGQWRVHYLGFARAGWTEAAQQFAQEFAVNPASGPNWQGATFRLLDLTQVDTDLCQWAESS